MEWQLYRAMTSRQPRRMSNRSDANWRLRIGLLFSATFGIAWGILLGWLEIRVNAWLSPYYVLFVGMPIAFLGSMVAGIVCHRMLIDWHKMARLLMAILVVAIGFPIGLIWSVLAHGYDPFQLVEESGPAVWNLEWIMALLGLFGGMYPRWTIPFLKLLARFGAWLSQGPAAILHWLGNKITVLFEPIISFFEAAGHAFLWLPIQLYRAITALFQNPRTTRERRHRPPPETLAPRRTRSTTTHRRPRTAKPRRASTLAKNNGNDALRLTGVVEDRCPYCLDVVKRNDPRGIKKCEVCGTPHHADCWAITGKCQVPHLNT